MLFLINEPEGPRLFGHILRNGDPGRDRNLGAYAPRPDSRGHKMANALPRIFSEAKNLAKINRKLAKIKCFSEKLSKNF